MDPTVVAFYYDWYGNPGHSGAWRHWDECHYATRHPGRSDAAGHLDLGAAHTPVLGAYDSLDPAVCSTHVAQAAGCGIDVFAATWWGQRDRRYEPLLAAAAGSPVRVALYWETLTDPDGGVAAALADLTWVLEQVGSHPAYWRIDGRPAVFVYRRCFSQLRRWDDWGVVLQQLRADREVVLLADTSALEALPLFDGYHVTTSALQVALGHDVEHFNRAMATACRDAGKYFAAAVIPGFDNARVHERGRLIVDRRGGELYDQQWGAALSSDPDLVMINSFNEWHEGSEIEPSLEFGDQYLQTTRAWIQRYRAEAVRRE
ncbi:MAG: glycoside hydrolase family 99-like domain-containing protein [Chloroflexi bacterium]|nr:glycoside hydrolase family 99-like domain-containing protein [Chloroflexota bacterium]